MSCFLDDVFRYVSMTGGDLARLSELHHVLEPEFPAIAEQFYQAVLEDPRTAAILSGPDQVQRLRMSLIDWMSTGLLGPHDEKFYDKRSRIGRRHVQIGLAQEYMFTGMTVVRLAYQERIFAAFPGAAAAAPLAAVNKLLDVELAIMVRHYQLDTESRLVHRERHALSDRLLAMQTLTAGLAHEVRNPLNAAKLQLELLDRRLRREHDDPRFTEPSSLASQEMERLTRLLNDFLAFARPPELNLEERDIAELVRHVYEVERPGAEKHGAAFELVVSPAHLTAKVDAPKLHQIVANIIRNAIEAVPPGGHVTVELEGSHESFTLRVHDDGPGISEAVKTRIYEPFFSTKESGTGLGMSIVYSLVTLHGGAIAIDTNDRGTRFDVTIPRRQ